MKQKLNVAILCGGKSAEHEVSIQSARSVIAALDPERYEATLIAIDKQGHWHLGETAHLLVEGAEHMIQHIAQDPNHLAVTPGIRAQPIVQVDAPTPLNKVDVVFPILHGPFGEDGTIQGLLKLANIPCVGSDLLSSAICMDKEIMKRLLKEAGLPVTPFITVHYRDRQRLRYEDIASVLSLPFFVKPANLGSSVGISKVHHAEEFETAVTHAFNYDNKIIFEAYVKGREIEISVLGNDDPIASLPGEIIPQHKHEFYSYSAKYLDDDGALLKFPVTLPTHVTERLQSLALQAFKTMGCSGMARVDFFLREDESIVINELNTIPGFTQKISMYPKLWEVSGVSYSELIHRLIQLALEKFSSEQRLKTEYT